MGCDIHAMLEVEGESPVAFAFNAIFAGQASLPRNLAVFGALAGVRSTVPPLYPPRGIPDNVSEESFEEYYLFVINEADAEMYRGYGYVTRDEAPIRGRVYWKTSGLQSRFGYVADPDWHTPSWLFLSEIHEALAHAKLTAEDLMPEYRIVLDALASAERWLGRRARLVFWFDN